MSPYDPLPHATLVEKSHASSAPADHYPPSSRHELNALVVHHQHSHRKETWTRGKRLLNLHRRHPRLNLALPQLLRCSRLHRRLSRYLRHHQLSHWDQGAHTPSSTLTIPISALRPLSYTTRRSPLSRSRSMGRRTTWQSS